MLVKFLNVKTILFVGLPRTFKAKAGIYKKMWVDEAVGMWSQPALDCAAQMRDITTSKPKQWQCVYSKPPEMVEVC